MKIYTTLDATGVQGNTGKVTLEVLHEVKPKPQKPKVKKTVRANDNVLSNRE